MKRKLVIACMGLLFISCFTNNERENAQTQNSMDLTHKASSTKMKIKIGSDIFTAGLYENQTTEAFKSLLPLTLTMTELNANEKYAQLASSLPTQAEEIKTIQKGDIMLWGANTLVVFYKTFQTSYRYTKIGRIENPEHLVSALGNEDVTLSFELE